MYRRQPGSKRRAAEVVGDLLNWRNIAIELVTHRLRVLSPD